MPSIVKRGKIISGLAYSLYYAVRPHGALFVFCTLFPRRKGDENLPTNAKNKRKIKIRGERT